MLQTGRSLWLEGGPRIRGAWSVPGDPQRNSLVIVLRRAGGKSGRGPAPSPYLDLVLIKICFITWKLALHSTKSFARFGGESREWVSWHRNCLLKQRSHNCRYNIGLENDRVGKETVLSGMNLFIYLYVAYFTTWGVKLSWSDSLMKYNSRPWEDSPWKFDSEAIRSYFPMEYPCAVLWHISGDCLKLFFCNT